MRYLLLCLLVSAPSLLYAQPGLQITAARQQKLNWKQYHIQHLSEKPETKTPQPIAPDFYAQHLPFFCRQELQMQRRHIPVAFRLGSMEQCNRLEQKSGYTSSNR